MEAVIIDRTPVLPPLLYDILPRELCLDIEAVLPERAPEEIRLRRGRVASLTVAGKNILLHTVLDGVAMEALFLRLCGGSPYAHAETLRKGYMTLPGGIRLGITGRAVTANGEIGGVMEPGAIVLRIPGKFPPIGGEIFTLFEELGGHAGILLYGPPGVGKTTLLAGVAALLAGGDHPRRTALIDTREELGPRVTAPELLLDVLTAYPKGVGIGIAAQVMAAEVILCDEIGDMAEANAILDALHCGVPLIATAHAGSLEELRARPGIRMLLRERCFGAAVGIRRGECPFTYRLDPCLTEDMHDIF